MFAVDAAYRADRVRHGRFWLIPFIAIVALTPAFALAGLDGSQGWMTLSDWGDFPSFQPAPSWLPDWLSMDEAEHAAAETRWERLVRDQPAGMALLLFFAFLPAINAPIDWLSLAVSRYLLAMIATPPQWVTTISDHFAPITDALEWPIHVLVIAIDAAVALLLACLVVVTTAFGFALLNEVHKWGGGSGLGLLPDSNLVSAWIAAIRANPGDPHFWWIYAMMFWTLVPTLVHLFAFAANLAAKAGRDSVRKQWSENLANATGRPAPAAWNGLRLAMARIFPGVLLSLLLLSFQGRVLDALGCPVEFLGDKLGLQWACTEDLTPQSIGICLAEGSERIALTVEAWFAPAD